MRRDRKAEDRRPVQRTVRSPAARKAGTGTTGSAVPTGGAGEIVRTEETAGIAKVITAATVPRGIVRTQGRPVTVRVTTAATVLRGTVRMEDRVTVQDITGIITAATVQTITAGIVPRGTARMEGRPAIVRVRADTGTADVLTVLSREAVRITGEHRAEGTRLDAR